MSMKNVEEDVIMMDLIMLVILAACIGSIYALIGWCQKQVDRNE